MHAEPSSPAPPAVRQRRDKGHRSVHHASSTAAAIAPAARAPPKKGCLSFWKTRKGRLAMLKVIGGTVIVMLVVIILWIWFAEQRADAATKRAAAAAMERTARAHARYAHRH